MCLLLCVAAATTAVEEDVVRRTARVALFSMTLRESQGQRVG